MTDRYSTARGMTPTEVDLSKDDGFSGKARWLVLSIILVVAVMVAHYWTDMSNVAVHNVYRRLAYIPIVLAALSNGFRGGILTAVAACVAYAPHAFFAAHRDPSPTVDKALEMLLYLLIGGLTGWLSGRRQQAHRTLQKAVAERDALEGQLLLADKMSALGQMAAGLAHEIRNPLASILGSVEGLVSEFDENHRKHRLGELLLTEIDRLNQVVSEFVRFARPAEPARAPVELSSLVQHVVELTASESSARHVQTSIELDDLDCSVEADANQLTQVLLNLLLNAYQAFERAESADAARTVRVGFTSRIVNEQNYLGVFIEDNGPGIPDELRENVFNPFFSTRSNGLGLGLSVSERIVARHGGFIEIQPRKVGTAVSFFLPRRLESKP